MTQNHCQSAASLWECQCSIELPSGLNNCEANSLQLTDKKQQQSRPDCELPECQMGQNGNTKVSENLQWWLFFCKGKAGVHSQPERQKLVSAKVAHCSNFHGQEGDLICLRVTNVPGFGQFKSCAVPEDAVLSQTRPAAFGQEASKSGRHNGCRQWLQ